MIRTNTWIVRYLPTKSEANMESVGDSNISPPSPHVIMVVEACVPLNVMKGLSAGTTIFSLLNHLIKNKQTRERERFPSDIRNPILKRIYNLILIWTAANQPVCSWLDQDEIKLWVIRWNSINGVLNLAIISISRLVNPHENGSRHVIRACGGGSHERTENKQFNQKDNNITTMNHLHCRNSKTHVQKSKFSVLEGVQRINKNGIKLNYWLLMKKKMKVNAWLGGLGLIIRESLRKVNG